MFKYSIVKRKREKKKKKKKKGKLQESIKQSKLLLNKNRF